MKNAISIEVRRFPVLVWNTQANRIEEHSATVSKQQLQAAQLVGQSSKELISRLFEREGMKALVIGKAERKSIVLDLETLWEMR